MVTGSPMRRYLLSALTLVVFTAIFVLPFVFVLLQAMKTRQEAALLQFSLPTEVVLWDNIVQVFQARDYMLVTAFINSTILTVASVTLMVVFAAMVGYVLQRRLTRWTGFINFLVLAGLIIPPAVVPTIWVLQGLGLFRTLTGLIFIEVAFGLSFSVLLFRAFMSTIPRQLDEAAVIDGAGPIRTFFQVVFPLMRSVAVTVIVVQSVQVFNDFVHPLYFLPGDENATVQLTLYNFQSQFEAQYNLLFADILLITIPPLLMFIFFNKKIVAGMTAGAVKG
ncbi:carbohydrate ABC transporter permease [Ornithinicoccus halotolerans]|uniref:carbohydrate ABC transporter permease n=1 Tax=Ornithinicoccus halotolerans TaxID=1748220 RepID=UPI00129578A8|nr:carbohydrate ABC transporter permease [Ornithinicoccus halotolerans]